MPRQKQNDEDDQQFANQGYELQEIEAGYIPTEEENKLEAKLPDPPSGGTGEQGDGATEE